MKIYILDFSVDGHCYQTEVAIDTIDIETTAKLVEKATEKAYEFMQTMNMSGEITNLTYKEQE